MRAARMRSGTSDRATVQPCEGDVLMPPLRQTACVQLNRETAVVAEAYSAKRKRVDVSDTTRIALRQLSHYRGITRLGFLFPPSDFIEAISWLPLAITR